MVLIALIFGVAAFIPGPYTWIWLTFAMALLHFGGAIVSELLRRTAGNEVVGIVRRPGGSRCAD